MIVDYYYPDGWDDVGYPTIYERTRTKENGLKIKIIRPSDVGYITPHCWIPANTHPKTLSRVVTRYPGVQCRRGITAKGNDGIDLVRLDVPNPNTFWELKEELRTYEADMPYPDQHIIGAYPDVDDIPIFAPRIWYFDMEWQPQDPHEGATTMIAIDDTHAEHPVVFAWKDGQEEYTIDWKDEEGGYLLHLYCSEDAMHEGFIQYLDECDPDMLIAHAMMWADLPQLLRRLPNPDRLSPINEVIRPRKNVGYKDTAQPILGRLCFDTAPAWNTGTGLETLYQKSGKGQFRQRSLKIIAEDLNLADEHGEQGEKKEADVLTWWTENFDEFVDYCVRDTTLLRKCTEKLSAIPFFTTMQKVCGVQFSSTHNVTNYIRGMFARRTTLKGRTIFNRQREDYSAATVADTKPGRHEGVACIDFLAMYPIIIKDSNVCVTTKRNQGGEGIRSLSNGTHWEQRRKGILPSIVEDMMELRAEYKAKMKNALKAGDEDAYYKYDMLQLAVKVATNACYGYVSQKKVGGAWIDPDIGATITHFGRKAISILLTESERKGYAALAGHTDSGYIQIPFDKVDEHIDFINQKISEELKLPNMKVEFEAYFDYWTTADVKNQNFGIMTWPEEKKGTLKVTGFAYKASSVSPVTREIHGLIFNLVGIGAGEREVTEVIRPISLAVLKKEKTIEDLAPFGKIGQEKYERKPPMAARAGIYYNEHLATISPFRVGDSVQWIYVKASPDGLPHTEAVGFRNVDEIDGFVIDYPTAVEKFVRAKIKRIYKVLGWNSLGEACGEKLPKKHW